MVSAFPLLLIPLVLFNIIAIIAGAGIWADEVLAIPMIGATWTITWGDLMVLLGLVVLFFEMLKSARPAPRTIANHLASTAILIIYVIEFVLVGLAENSTFFLLTVISVFDVAAGFTISIRTASRDVTYTRDPGGVV
jgi:hypothetical protein